MTAIRKACSKDLEQILKIYAHAREFMKQNGNPRQWGDHWPPREVIEKDIEEQKSYVMTDDDDIAHAVFFYKYGDHCDATYDKIYDGQWQNDSAYGVVHRIASDGVIPHAGKACIRYALSMAHHLRMDTHGDNIVMQHVLKGLGFTYCGVIYVEEDNDPRLAFEITLPQE